MKKMYRKRFLSGLATVALAVLTLASCSKGPDMGELISDDAIAVFNLDLGALWNKGDIDNIESLSFAKLGLQQLRSDDPQTAKLIDAIIADPMATGLNLKKDLTAYFAVDDDISGAVMGVMHKRKKFEEFLTQFAKDNELTLDIKDNKGWRVATLESEESAKNCVVFNNKAAVVLFSNEMLDDFMELKHSESLASNKNFRQYWKNRSEISLWMSLESVYDMASRYGEDIKSMATSIYGEDFWNEIEHSSFAINTTFDKGVIRSVITCQGISDRYIKKYMQKFNGDLVDLMPGKTYAAISMAYNLKEMTKILDKNKDLDIDLDEELMDDVTLRDVLSAFGGSMLIDLFDIEIGEDGSVIPMIAIAFDLKNADIIRRLLESDDLGLAKVQDDVYSLEGLFNFPVCVCISDKALFVSNSGEAIQTFREGKSKYAMEPVAKKVKAGNYLYFDLDPNHYPDGIRTLLPQSLVSLMGNFTEYTEYKTNDAKSGEFDLYIKDKKQNSLLATLHFVDDNLVELGKLFDEIGGSSSRANEEEYYAEEGEDDDWEYDD